MHQVLVSQRFTKQLNKKFFPAVTSKYIIKTFEKWIRTSPILIFLYPQGIRAIMHLLKENV